MSAVAIVSYRNGRLYDIINEGMVLSDFDQIKSKISEYDVKYPEIPYGLTNMSFTRGLEYETNDGILVFVDHYVWFKSGGIKIKFCIFDVVIRLDNFTFEYGKNVIDPLEAINIDTVNSGNIKTPEFDIGFDNLFSGMHYVSDSAEIRIKIEKNDVIAIMKDFVKTLRMVLLIHKIVE